MIAPVRNPGTLCGIAEGVWLYVPWSGLNRVEEVLDAWSPSGRGRVGVVPLVLVAMIVAPTPALGQLDDSAAEVEAREIAFAKTFADRDMEAFLSFVSPEAIFFNGNEPSRGHDAIAQLWAPNFDGADAPFSWHPDVIEVLESGRLALSSGPVRGASGEEVGRFNSIWRKDADGQWRVVFDKGS